VVNKRHYCKKANQHLHRTYTKIYIGKTNNLEYYVLGVCIMGEYFCGRFIKFKTFPWGDDRDEILELNNISIKLRYITESEIRWIKTYKNIDKNLRIGYVAILKSKLLECAKYVNIDREYFDNIYSKIYEMDFENIMLDSETGYDGEQFEVIIGQNNGLNKCFKKIGLWSPPSSANVITVMKINKLLEIYDSIKEVIEYNEWYKNILLKESEIR